MPSKLATCCKEKAVLVAVYVEKPRRRKSISKQSNGHNNQQHHHHHHHHHHYHHLHRVKRGSNRRADLLNYSQRLRESAKSGASSPNHHHPKPAPPVVSTTKHIGPPQDPQPVASLRQLGPPLPMAKIIPSPSKTKNRKGPSCMDWKNMVPRLLKSMAVCQAKREVKKKKKKMMKKGDESASKKAKAIMKSFKGPKKGGFLSKLFATIQKYR